MSATRAGRALGALGVCLAGLACGEAEGERGSVMLAISTDMYVDKDLSRVDIVVQPENGPAQSTQVNLFPALEGRFLPGTFAIIEGSAPGEFVRVRLVARQADRARVVREAALKIPRQRTALLAMPIQWLCDGHVRQDDQQTRSDCEDGYTCVSGLCKLDEVEEASLPDYTASEVFGGGNATGGGSCFDTIPCFEGAEQPALDLQRCVLDTQPSPELNVAAVLPPGGDGHCTASECWIPLDASELTGWSGAADGSGVQLPQGLCERVRAGTARVRTSHSCASKSPSTPTCGPWSLVGTEPGEEELPTGPAVAAANTLAAELDARSAALAQRLASACGQIAGQSPPTALTPTLLTSLCQLAGTAMAPNAPLTWYHLPARCWPDHERQLSCEHACSNDCDPGTVSSRCELNSLAAACDGVCSSRQCLGNASTPTSCAGACDGTVIGDCQGSCLGQCDGSCAAPTGDGNCDGACSGTCKGLCIGRTVGQCAGHCDGDPNLGATTCAAGTLCLAGCSGTLSSPRCASLLGTSPCTASGCISDCGAIGRLDQECETATARLLPPPGMDAGLVTTIEQALGELVTIRDGESAPALDEASRRLTMLSGSPTTLAATFTQAKAALELLSAVRTNAINLLDAVGPARLGPGAGPGAGPVLGPTNSCDVKQATGSAPLIDDFEDGNSGLLPNDGRTGTWHVGWDGSGEISMTDPPLPVEGGASGTGKALHLSGSGQLNWGANLNLELRSGASPYDASVYRGLKFSTKGIGTLRVVFMTQNLAPPQPCSTCDMSGGECGLLYSSSVSLSDVWSPIILDWPNLVPPTQINTPFSPNQLMTIQFEVDGPDPFDLWLDDVAFYGP